MHTNKLFNDVLSNVELHLRVSFLRTTLTSPNNYEGNGIYRSADATVSVRKIDIGPANTFAFYIFSVAPDAALLTVPDEATGQQLGSQTVTTTPVASNGAPMSLAPFHGKF
jgi:hypothetical protein